MRRLQAREGRRFDEMAVASLFTKIFIIFRRALWDATAAILRRLLVGPLLRPRTAQQLDVSLQGGELTFRSIDAETALINKALKAAGWHCFNVEALHIERLTLRLPFAVKIYRPTITIRLTGEACESSSTPTGHVRTPAATSCDCAAAPSIDLPKEPHRGLDAPRLGAHEQFPSADCTDNAQNTCRACASCGALASSGFSVAGGCGGDCGPPTGACKTRGGVRLQEKTERQSQGPRHGTDALLRLIRRTLKTAAGAVELEIERAACCLYRHSTCETEGPPPRIDGDTDSSNTHSAKRTCQSAGPGGDGLFSKASREVPSLAQLYGRASEPSSASSSCPPRRRSLSRLPRPPSLREFPAVKLGRRALAGEGLGASVGAGRLRRQASVPGGVEARETEAAIRFDLARLSVRSSFARNARFVIEGVSAALLCDGALSALARGRVLSWISKPSLLLFTSAQPTNGEAFAEALRGSGGSLSGPADKASADESLGETLAETREETPATFVENSGKERGANSPTRADSPLLRSTTEDFCISGSLTKGLARSRLLEDLSFLSSVNGVNGVKGASAFELKEEACDFDEASRKARCASRGKALGSGQTEGSFVVEFGVRLRVPRLRVFCGARHLRQLKKLLDSSRVLAKSLEGAQGEERQPCLSPTAADLPRGGARRVSVVGDSTSSSRNLFSATAPPVHSQSCGLRAESEGLWCFEASLGGEALEADLLLWENAASTRLQSSRPFAHDSQSGFETAPFGICWAQENATDETQSDGEDCEARANLRGPVTFQDGRRSPQGGSQVGRETLGEETASRSAEPHGRQSLRENGCFCFEETCEPLKARGPSWGVSVQLSELYVHLVACENFAPLFLPAAETAESPASAFVSSNAFVSHESEVGTAPLQTSEKNVLVEDSAVGSPCPGSASDAVYVQPPQASVLTLAAEDLTFAIVTSCGSSLTGSVKVSPFDEGPNGGRLDDNTSRLPYSTVAEDWIRLSASPPPVRCAAYSPSQKSLEEGLEGAASVGQWTLLLHAFKESPRPSQSLCPPSPLDGRGVGFLGVFGRPRRKASLDFKGGGEAECTVEASDHRSETPASSQTRLASPAAADTKASLREASSNSEFKSSLPTAAEAPAGTCEFRSSKKKERKTQPSPMPPSSRRRRRRKKTEEVSPASPKSAASRPAPASPLAVSEALVVDLPSAETLGGCEEARPSPPPEVADSPAPRSSFKSFVLFYGVCGGGPCEEPGNSASFAFAGEGKSQLLAEPPVSEALLLAAAGLPIDTFFLRLDALACRELHVPSKRSLGGEAASLDGGEGQPAQTRGAESVSQTTEPPIHSERPSVGSGLQRAVSVAAFSRTPHLVAVFSSAGSVSSGSRSGVARGEDGAAGVAKQGPFLRERAAFEDKAASPTFFSEAEGFSMSLSAEAVVGCVTDSALRELETVSQ